MNRGDTVALFVMSVNPSWQRQIAIRLYNLLLWFHDENYEKVSIILIAGLCLAGLGAGLMVSNNEKGYMTIVIAGAIVVGIGIAIGALIPEKH